MPPNTDDQVVILDHDFVQVEFAELDSLPEDVRSHPNDDMMANRPEEDCVSEKTFWKYARCILYFNAFYSPTRGMIYILVCFIRLLCCKFKKSKDAAGEVLKSILVLFAALAAIAVTDDLVKISNCTAEVLFEFLIGGLTLQICLGFGDAIINCVLNWTAADLTFEKILESILEPIVFFGGLFSAYLYFKADKCTLKAQHAKYSAIGNLIGSTVAVTLASYLCFRIEATQTVQHYTPAPVIGLDSVAKYQEFPIDVPSNITSCSSNEVSLMNENVSNQSSEALSCVTLHGKDRRPEEK